MTQYKAPAGMSVGHVHLKVSDLNRSIEFYRDVLGLTVTQKMGDDAAFLSAGGYHHHIGLNTWESRGAAPNTGPAPGLYHLALLFPARHDLGRALLNLDAHKIILDGAADHGVSQALYFNDPDGNGIELCWDRPRAEWPRDTEGKLRLASKRLNLNALRQEARVEQVEP